MIALFRRRVFDVSALTGRGVRVKCDSVAVPVRTFGQYVDLYLVSNAKKVCDAPHERWEYAVALAPNHEFTQISFVNGIHTNKGGKHVDYIVGQITRKLVAYIEKKKKIIVKATTIKEQLMVFLRCDIVNPSFDSQTKDYMSTPMAKFGSSCTVSDQFIEKVAKMGIMDAACALTQVKDNQLAAKKTDGSKKRHISGIPKLIDANFAGTDRSSECTVILCEGDSAKAGIVSGLSKQDRDTVGVYPMKGKLFNVRGELAKRISENKEITEIKKILGLENGKQYTESNIGDSLRYGRILFMTDQDLDGSHIKGLGLNLFESEWNTLSRIPNFIGYMNTPILKARKGKEIKVFYSDTDFEMWKTHIGAVEADRWSTKYYKGLGTSTATEFKEYFKDKKIVVFEHLGNSSTNAIDMIFNKKRADDRKTWLAKYNRELAMDCSKQSVSFEEFIDREMIHFSKYDCDRSIPNVMDGLKISLRKILFAAFKKRLHTEIKVAQFTGYVSEHSGYHHGEQSLNGAIVAMAQTFVGSNNINLFQGNGQFGTRLQGGSDSASERYIFTLLNPITRSIFPESDDVILKYLKDDGTPVEPIFYAPIIPMLLVNGSKGIGTGFSTDIMSYNPIHIIARLRAKLNNTDTTTPIEPYYEGFKGTIQCVKGTDESVKYLFRGIYNVIQSDTIHVTELPIGLWTDDFKQYIESLCDPNGKKLFGGKPFVREYTDMSTDTSVDFTIRFQKGVVAKLCDETHENNVDGIERLMKLVVSKQTTNMHAFDGNERLKRYNSVDEIIDDYYIVRLDMYSTRRDTLINRIDRELRVITNKVRYIEETLDNMIDLRRRTRDEIREMLCDSGYEQFDGDDDYKYLVKMTMDSVTKEAVERMTREKMSKNVEYDDTINTSPKQMWLRELDVLDTKMCELAAKRVVTETSNPAPIQKKKMKRISNSASK